MGMDGIKESKRKIRFELERVIKRIEIEDATVEKTPETAKENVSEFEELASTNSQLEQRITQQKTEFLDLKKAKKDRKAKIMTITMQLYEARVDFKSLQDNINWHIAKMSCASMEKGIVSNKFDTVGLELSNAQKRLDALNMHASNKLESSQDLELAKAQKEVAMYRDLHACLSRLVASFSEDISKYETEIKSLEKYSNPLKKKVSELKTQLELETAALARQKDKISKLQHDIDTNSYRVILANNALECYTACLLRPRELFE